MTKIMVGILIALAAILGWRIWIGAQDWNHQPEAVKAAVELREQQIKARAQPGDFIETTTGSLYFVVSHGSGSDVIWVCDSVGQSSEEMTVRSFARAGGALIQSGDSAMYNETAVRFLKGPYK